VYQGLGCDDIMYEGQVDSSKHPNLPYDDVERHYHVITNLIRAMAKRYVCLACHIHSRRDVTHVSDQTCSDCKARPPCAVSGTRSPAMIVTDILEVCRVSPTTSRVGQRKCPFANVNDFARRVDGSRRMPDKNVTKYFVPTVRRIGMWVTCAS